ncbi:MAG: signal peptide peptidase SppA [Alphaproteobacteria bacterium]|nr:signal peptide peptidase SppA [Alphaproteobacteria bacterium]
MPKNFKHRPLYAQNLPKEVTKPKMEWKILPLIWGALKRTAMVLGFFVLIQTVIVLLIIVPATLAAKDTESLPEEIVLYLNFDGSLDEVHAAKGLSDAFDQPKLTLKQTIDALYRASSDDRVKGMVARMSAAELGTTQVYELNQALDAFKASGKFAYVYSSSYGEAARGVGAYSFISNFDQIWMQPMGIVTITGANAQMPFMRKTLDRIGITPNFFQRKDYKTAYENLTDSKMSKENRETISRLIGDIRDDILNTAPKNMGIDKAQFNSLVNKGLFTAEEAQVAGLVTHLDYADVLIGNVKEAVKGDREADDDLFVTLQRYAGDSSAHKSGSKKASKVALIYVVGAIVQNADSGGIPGTSGVAAAENIAPAILNAADDEDVRAIVVRVDSPGGSPVASESILRSIERAQAKGKMVIVSMGATAASGGYWISAYADRIFVMPSTITGSIGVVGGKFAFDGLFDTLDVNWEGVKWGQNSGMWSINTPFSKSEAERINAMLDAVYDGFVSRVAKGRKMTPEAVDAIAGGRVWSGKRAVEIGLADQFGGLNDALDYVAKQIGKDDRNDLNVVIMPEPKTALQHFLELIEGQAVLGGLAKQNAALFEWLGPLNDAAVQVSRPNDFMVMERLQVE